MYTSCPDCGTVFRIAAEDLRRAGGQVRCGSCGSAFNALASLSASAPEPVPEPAAPGALSVPQPATDTGGEDPLEFNVPAERWTSFFSATDAPPTPWPPADPAKPAAVENPDSANAEEAVTTADDAAAGEADSAPAAPDLDDELSPEDWDELLADLPEQVYVIDSAEKSLPAALQQAEHDAAAVYPAEQLATTIEMPPARERLYPPPASRARAPAPVPPADPEPADPYAGFPAYSGPPVPPAIPRRRRWPFALGSLLLALVLLIQWAHMERDRLAVHPAVGEMVRTSYGQLGQTLYPAWDLQAYDISGLEAIAGGSQADALDIAARLEFRGSTPAGLPLLRVTVTDRWSNVVGQRLISPAEYAKQRPAALIAPGAVVPVQVSVRDPGIDAHGFEVDICLQQRRAGLVCQQRETPFR